MTDEREREIEARERAATPKPLRKDRQVNREQEGVTLSGDTLVINVWDADTPQAEEAWAALIQHAKADLSYLLAQLREARGMNAAWKQAVKEDTAGLRRQRDEAIERAEAAEGLLEAAWLQSGHPHFQTWYESLTLAQRGEGDA